MAKVRYRGKNIGPGAIILLSVSAFLFAYIGGPALVAMAAINTTGMDTATAAMVDLISIAFILAVMIMFFSAAGFELNT